MPRVSRRKLLGLRVLDRNGDEIGQVIDTWPDDGGWEVELVLVRLRRSGDRRMLPVGDMVVWPGALLAPWSRMQIEDAPAADGGVHRAEDPYRAIDYWRFEEPETAGIVTPRWRRSSGSSGTGRPSHTGPSPTPTAS
jgi:hypothetical protein